MRKAVAVTLAILLGVCQTESGEYRTVKISGGQMGHKHAATHKTDKIIYMTRYFTDEELPFDFVKDDLKWIMKVTPFYLKFYNEKHNTNYKRADLDDATTIKIMRWAINEDVPKDLQKYKFPDTPETRFLLYHFGQNVTEDYVNGKKLDSRVKKAMDNNLDKLKYLDYEVK